MKRSIIYSIFWLLAAAAVLPACSDDDAESPWFESGHDQTTPVLLGPVSTEEGISDPRQRIVVYSNTYWNIESDAPEWCTVYPRTGHNEGRIYVSAAVLDDPYDRTCTLTVRDDAGNVITTIPVRQTGVEKRLQVPAGTSVSSDGDSGILIDIDTNINWAAELADPADASWIELGTPDLENNQLPLVVRPNTGDAREAKIRFYMVEEPDLFPDAVLTVRQVQYATAGNAALKSIAEVLASYDGTIEDNIKIEGVVVNDRTTLNYPVGDAQVILQDASGRGAPVTFANAALNTYAPGDRLTLWLMGASCSAATGGISGIGTANIISVGTGGDVAVAISDLSAIGPDLGNTLVRLRNVTFAVPLGTLYNVTLADLECDLTIRDASGNAFTVRTRDAYTDKHAKNVASGSYDLTGIVDITADGPVLRLRSAADMQPTGGASYRSIAEWYGDKSAVTTTGWTPATGSGTATFGVAISSGDKKSSFARKECTAEYSDANTWWGPSLKAWNGSEQCYKFEVSTAGATGDIYVSLWSISYSSSVKEMKVEWAESAAATQWTDCGVILEQNNTADGINNEYLLGTYSVRVPGAQGRDKVCFRVTKASDKRVDGKTSAISATGPNYMCYFGVFELR